MVGLDSCLHAEIFLKIKCPTEEISRIGEQAKFETARSGISGVLYYDLKYKIVGSSWPKGPEHFLPLGA